MNTRGRNHTKEEAEEQNTEQNIKQKTQSDQTEQNH